MEKTRVKKGEIYWYISDDLSVHFTEEMHLCVDDSRYKVGNYFHTYEEAESVARKLRAVLNGADVIEIPEEEEILKKQTACNPFQFNNTDGTLSGSGYENGLYNGFVKGFGYCKNWLKSKIVK